MFVIEPHEQQMDLISMFVNNPYEQHTMDLCSQSCLSTHLSIFSDIFMLFWLFLCVDVVRKFHIANMAKAQARYVTLHKPYLMWYLTLAVLISSTSHPYIYQAMAGLWTSSSASCCTFLVRKSWWYKQKHLIVMVNSVPKKMLSGCWLVRPN